MKHYDIEEDFHSQDRKKFRKDRKLAQKMDRSKFKKSDSDKEQKEEIREDLLQGRVITITADGIFVDVAGKKSLYSLKGALKKEQKLSKNLIAVGDFVRVDQETIAQIEPRFSKLTRTDVTGKKEQLIAANIDQVIIVASIGAPPLKPSLIDRYLIAAEKGNMRPVIVINKIDLLETLEESEQQNYQEFLVCYEKLGIPVLPISTYTKVGIEALISLLKGKTSVFSGQSGVGKSSLLNIAFSMKRDVKDLTSKTAKGSHTTTQAELLTLPHKGYSIDTPGIRSFGVFALTKEDLLHHFQEFFPYKKRCHYSNCSHIDEKDCSVQRALKRGKISWMRYQSYCTLYQEIEQEQKSTTWG